MKRFWSKWSKLTQIYFKTFGFGPNCDHQSRSRDLIGLGEIEHLNFITVIHRAAYGFTVSLF